MSCGVFEGSVSICLRSSIVASSRFSICCRCCSISGLTLAFSVSENRSNWSMLLSPTSESPHRMAWSRNVNGLSFASVRSQSDSFAISTASGFLSTP